MRRFNETYKKRQFISRNDWADTYKSIHAQTEETVILKVISNRSKNEKYINNLLKEVEELKKIKNSNLTSVHEIFKYDGIGEAHYYYIEGEYFKGITLKEKLSDGKFEKYEAVKILGQLAKALEKFHNMSKSFEVLNIENILVKPKGPKNPNDIVKIDILSYLENQRFEADLQENIGDLEKDESDKETDENKFSPDKDIFSLGVILYSLLSGKTYFEKEKYKKDINDENLLKIIEKSTNKELPKRYTNLSIFINDLKSYLDNGELISDTYEYYEESLDNKNYKKDKPKKKKFKKVLGVCVLLLLLGTISIKGFDLLNKININNYISVDDIKQDDNDTKKEEKKSNEEEQNEEEKVDKSKNDKSTTSNNSNTNKQNENKNSNNSNNSNNNKNSNNNINSSTTNNSNSNTSNNGSSSNSSNTSTEKPSNPENNTNSGSTNSEPNTENGNNGVQENQGVITPDNSTNSGNNGSEGSITETPSDESQE
ncbi:protein kinase domain-containing protein [Terrisporobacter sp.]|uniref:protein kinase domain-containing protein n=1 Tax=Terrisporobacter sp. TaxID=1965305 RepID=UPI00261BB820|nr:protein kinase [Terrisporobacter sp.]